MAGKRVNLSDLASEPALPEARKPAITESTPRSARVQQVAANPLNTRDLDADRAKIESIAESLKTHGQLQPCAVVARDAFLRIYPEHETTIGSAVWVQVTGGRRRAAALLVDQPTLEIVVKNNLADSREAWVSATAAENLDRENLDPIEEARAVQLLVQECGTAKAAAARLSRTPPWVTQRLNLLKLAPEVQSLLRAGEVPLRDVRDLHQVPAEEQFQELQQRRQPLEPELTAVNQTGDSSATTPGTNTNEESKRSAPRRSAAASAIRRLGGTPDKIADSLRTELTPADLQLLIDHLQRQPNNVAG
ncbi:ParB/RepB/Spo0J family partition protein [Micromonospora sp.]|uniref:ParB/RepB/Spo0J family partition protein n=1 Tax=Micromonospora sp. TaxID=1876 RepID=UPI003B3A3500